jgi:hypothetical protein
VDAPLPCSFRLLLPLQVLRAGKLIRSVVSSTELFSTGWTVF